MKIKDLFAKNIDRTIQGVIKVGQEDNIEQELDEYVVTRELQDDFSKFFSAYEVALNGPTDNMGVWISGFFGSGKSHFLKIIADILENREVKGRRAVDFFQDKTKDPMTFSQMSRAADSATQVILFNIDAKAMTGQKNDANVIINVFLQVFNEMQGFSTTNAWIAEMERQLTKAGKYEAFKEAFEAAEENHLGWIEGRDNYAFNMGTIKDALVKIGFQDEADAQGFIDQLKTPFPINIEKFAKLVADYTEASGKRVAFLVDEVGQFIGDSVQRMLNLQTVVEDLGSATRGKAWVIVTSQQAIGDVTSNLNGQDFSKIQGRFKTRINLSSANVDEVIKKRLLAKTPEVQRQLEGVYTANAAAINNAIDFDDVQRDKYDSPKLFADEYPFVPYQFKLLQSVLTAIRTHGSDGKHLSEGERSMLSIFQESAERIMNADEGTLVPFSLFFEGLEQFLDHTHRIVIENARTDYQVINPKQEENPFALQVLKTLFMVKYVDNFKATLNNIVTLMIDSIDVDRIELTKMVKDALSRLIRQKFVEKNLDSYVFLTDAEQDIISQIGRQQVSEAEIVNALGTYWYDLKVIDNKYSYPKLSGRYVFTLNEFVDDTPIGKSNADLSIRIITPLNARYHDLAQAMLLSSGAPKEIIILTPDEEDYLDYIRLAERIRKFQLNSSTNMDARYRSLIDARVAERNELRQLAREHAVAALQDATIIVGGRELENGGGFENKFAEAARITVDNTFRNLSYIEVAKGEKDILKLLKDPDDLVTTKENPQAITEVQSWLARANDPHITLKSVLNRFEGVPFGYTQEDIEWIVAYLFTSGAIKLTYNGETVSPYSPDFTAQQLVDFLTKKQYTEKIAIQIRKTLPQQTIKKMRDIASQVFNKKSFSSDNPEALVSELKVKIAADLKNIELFENKNQKYPGHDLLQQGQGLLRELLGAHDSDYFFELIVKRYDDLLDWHDDFEDKGISDFYLNQNSQKIWDDGLNDLEIYTHSSDLINDAEVQKLVEQLKELLNSNRADNNIQQIKALDQQFDDQYTEMFDAHLEDVKQAIEGQRQEGADKLRRSNLPKEFSEPALNAFNASLDRIVRDAEDSGNLNDLNAKRNLASVKPNSLLNDIANQVEKIKQAEAAAEAERLQKAQADNTQHTTEIKSNETVNADRKKESSEHTTAKAAPTSTVRNIPTVDIKELSNKDNWTIMKVDDLDAFVEELRNNLQKRLDEQGVDGIYIHLN
ncbi:BREX system P-loop protein BrxC [Lacticaseibacillus mingshuiensis]|uniref:BREX system P-loop protein BrxC n=1 Tax=Lacticaseibacillus mingshuiensis TaxID=2799574 RepID=UPI0019406503|nr:BREX system P-loop protein BrxC [Lacticaseibacillus mingshuiensis]